MSSFEYNNKEYTFKFNFGRLRRMERKNKISINKVLTDLSFDGMFALMQAGLEHEKLTSQELEELIDNYIEQEDNEFMSLFNLCMEAYTMAGFGDKKKLKEEKEKEKDSLITI